MTRRHSADRPPQPTTRTPASWTPRAPCAIEVRASAVARRRVPNLEVPQGKGDKKEMAALSPSSSRIIGAPQAPRSEQRSRIRHSDSYRGRHDNHAWCRKFESRRTTKLENPATCGIPVLSMARPGLEPGTPRISVVISKRPAGAKSLETRRFQENRCSARMFGICGLFPGNSGVDGHLRPNTAARPNWVRRVTRGALRPDVGERGETGVASPSARARAERCLPARLGRPICASRAPLSVGPATPRSAT